MAPTSCRFFAVAALGAVLCAVSASAACASQTAGSYGRDRLHGGPGFEVIFAGWGDDRLYGGPGREQLVGGRGGDYIVGGRGAGKRNLASFNGDEGNDAIIGGPDIDGISPGPGQTGWTPALATTRSGSSRTGRRT